MEIIGNVIINLLNNGYFWWRNFEKKIQVKSILKSQHIGFGIVFLLS